MASLPVHATAEDIEDEISFQQALLDSLGEEVPTDDERRRNIETVMLTLEARLQGLTSTASSGSDDGIQSDGRYPELYSASRKRLGSELEEPLYPKRPTPDLSRSVTPSFLDVKGYGHASNGTTNGLPRAAAEVRAREIAKTKQQRLEEFARRKHEAEKADQEFARRLTTHFGSPSATVAGPSRSATNQSLLQSTSGLRPAVKFSVPSMPGSYPRIFDPPQKHGSPAGMAASPLRSTPSNGLNSSWNSPAEQPIVKSDPSHRSNHSANAPSRRTEVIDLTGDEDLPSAQPNRTNSALALPYSDPAAMRAQEMRHRYTMDIMAQRERAKQAQDAARREANRYQSGYVYGRPNASPAMPFDQFGRKVIPSQQQPADSVYDAVRGHLRGMGQGFQELGRDLSDLVYGRAGPVDDSDDEVVHMGSRSLHDDVATPDEIVKDLKNLMDNIRPDADIPADERDVEVPGMTVKLKPYQGTGLTWLQNMEAGTNKGGILADDMGLGKTVQAISLMVTRRSDDPLCKTTLILAPVALLRQWKEEIGNKIQRGRHSLSVFIHHGAGKKKSFKELRTFDVVLTTFGTIAAELKRKERFEARLENDPLATERPDEKSIFIDSESRWYRIIVDEAQCIKNKNTKTSKAAYLLQAKSRFCMTGTPMMNSIDELFSLIHFIKIRPYNDWKKFTIDFSRPVKSKNDESRHAAMQKLQVLLKAILLRRNKQSLINGKPILVLPQRTVEIANPAFTDEEKDFYKALETNTRIQFNKYVQAGTVGRSYAHILLLLLRLRQACCHPHLIKDFGIAAAADISPEQMTDLAHQLDEAVVNRIRESGGNFECPVCYDAVENPAIFVPCGHDTCSECFAKIADPANAVAAGEDGSYNARCPNCRGPINSKSVIDYETFKKVHLAPPEEPEVAADVDPAEAETESDSDATDSKAGSDVEDEEDDEDSDTDESETEDETLNGFIVKDEESTDSETELEDEGESKPEIKRSDSEEAHTTMQEETALVPVSRSVKAKGKLPMEKKTKKSKSKGKGKAKAKGKGKEKRNGRAKGKKKKGAPPQTLAELKKLSARSKGAKRKYLERLRRDWTSSTKIDRALEILQHIVDNTEEKVIIFSQWTSLLDLLEVPIDEKGWGYERYDGSMSSTARADAVDNFKGNRAMRMMLISLKAGNAGLNLNCASQVVILDPFWNPYIEDQAIDRAHRLGQSREVKVHRILVEETVEDRITALQDKKRDLINEALDEGAGQRAGRLSQQELAYLFGVTRTPTAAVARRS